MTVHRPKRLLPLAAAALAVLALAACSNSGGYYAGAPAAYGENGRCYYLDSPAETIALQAAGLCPTGWAPWPMPLYWHERYYGFYSSPAYVNRYVVVSHRTTVISHEHTFAKRYSSAIRSQSSKATYRTPPRRPVSLTKTRSGSTGSRFRSGRR